MNRIVSVIIILSILVSTAFSVHGYGGVDHGYSWNLDKETGILTISCDGAMKDYTSGNVAPWSGMVNNTYLGPLARYVYFKEGITHVSAYVLTIGMNDYSINKKQSCYNVIEVHLASSVSSVGNNAFNSGLKRLYVYSDSVEFGQYSVPSTAVIYGYADTDIERFATKNGNEFVAMCREHSTMLANELEATCISDGYTGDYVCTVCDMTTQKGEVISALGHDYKLTNITAPDCVNNGYSGDSQCSRCLDVEKYGETLPANGHSWSDWSVVSNPSCTDEGVKIRFCSVCEEQEKGTVQAFGHSLKENSLVESTCTDNGNIAYWSCNICDKHYTDADTTSEIDLSDTVITAKGHNISDWITVEKATFTSEGKKIKECTVCGLETETEILPKLTNPFADVSENAWYTKSVLYCFEKSYMNGMSETTFAPNGNITREQFVLILANISGVDTNIYKTTDSGMKDVPTGKWYSGAVAWAVQEGYVAGVAEGMFGLGHLHGPCRKGMWQVLQKECLVWDSRYSVPPLPDCCICMQRRTDSM